MSKLIICVLLLLAILIPISVADDCELFVKDQTQVLIKQFDTKKTEFIDDIQKFGNFLMEEAVKNIKMLLLFFALYILAIELIINGAIGLYRVKKETEMLNMIYTKINKIENKMEKYLPEGDDK